MSRSVSGISIQFEGDFTRLRQQWAQVKSEFVVPFKVPVGGDLPSGGASPLVSGGAGQGAPGASLDSQVHAARQRASISRPGTISSDSLIEIARQRGVALEGFSNIASSPTVTGPLTAQQSAAADRYQTKYENRLVRDQVSGQNRLQRFDAVEFQMFRAGRSEEEREARNADAAQKRLTRAMEQEAAAAERKSMSIQRNAQSIEQAEFQARVANAGMPQAQANMLNERLGSVTDPMERAKLQQQIGRLAPKTGLNRQVLGMGNFMNFMFGGWELSTAIGSLHAGRIKAALAGSDVESWQAQMEGITGATGGILGGIAREGQNIIGRFLPIESAEKMGDETMLESARRQSLTNVRKAGFSRQRSAAMRSVYGSGGGEDSFRLREAEVQFDLAERKREIQEQQSSITFKLAQTEDIFTPIIPIKMGTVSAIRDRSLRAQMISERKTMDLDITEADTQSKFELSRINRERSDARFERTMARRGTQAEIGQLSGIATGLPNPISQRDAIQRQNEMDQSAARRNVANQKTLGGLYAAQADYDLTVSLGTARTQALRKQQDIEEIRSGGYTAAAKLAGANMPIEAQRMRMSAENTASIMGGDIQGAIRGMAELSAFNMGVARDTRNIVSDLRSRADVTRSLMSGNPVGAVRAANVGRRRSAMAAIGDDPDPDFQKRRDATNEYLDVQDRFDINRAQSESRLQSMSLKHEREVTGMLVGPGQRPVSAQARGIFNQGEEQWTSLLDQNRPFDALDKMASTTNRLAAFRYDLQNSGRGVSADRLSALDFSGTSTDKRENQKDALKETERLLNEVKLAVERVVTALQ